MNIMALDISKSCGWAFARGWAQPSFGCEEFPRGSEVDEGKVFAMFRDWLDGMLGLHQVDLLLYEAPIHGVNDMRTTFVLIGMAAHVESVCWDRGVRVYQEAASVIRKHFIGKGKNGRGARKSSIKDDVGFKCRQLGWPVVNDNAADALATLAYARDCFLQPAPQQILGGVVNG
jgi:hypothetical protein